VVAVPARRAVFLDRDGVVNRAFSRDGRPYPPDDLDALEVLPGVPEALSGLRAAGFLNVIVTNQPDVRTGKQTRDVVDRMHAALLDALDIDAIEACFHVDADHCDCRKPKPGMLLAAAQRLGIDLSVSFLVGDRWRDIAAGQAAGCRAFFIDYGYDERRPEPPFETVASLAEAAGQILGAGRSQRLRRVGS
jgi:D-glycero-D-manno-heptose 1,7-bisphosphate phosphatase